jgi:hypothetical protein
MIAHQSFTLDILRLLLLLEGGIVLGLSLFVFRLYLFARSLARKRGEMPAGATPYHVSLIAISHALLVITQMAVLIGRFGTELAWYGSPVALVAFTLSIVSLIDMLQLQNSRIHHLVKH